MHCTDCSRPIDMCICGAFSRYRNSREERNLRDFFCNKLPEAGDRGQRYELRYLDADGSEHVMGWSEAYPHKYVDAIKKHPSWHSARVIDRRPS